MAYWGDTVLPLLGVLLEDINRWLAPPCSASRGFSSGTTRTRSRRWSRRRARRRPNRIEANRTTMTPNEKREAMGLEAYIEPPEKPGADSICSSTPRRCPIELAGKLDPNLHPALAEDVPATAKPAVEPAKKPEGGQQPKRSDFMALTNGRNMRP